MTMKNVLTMLKTPDFVRNFARLESVHQNEDQMFYPADVVDDLYNFVATFYEDSEQAFLVSVSCPCCDPDLNAYRMSKVINDERYVIEVRKERYEFSENDASVEY